jgi:hypothetical protein
LAVSRRNSGSVSFGCGGAGSPWSAPVTGCVVGRVGLVCVVPDCAVIPFCANAGCMFPLTKTSPIATVACKSLNLTYLFSNVFCLGSVKPNSE